MCNKFAELKKKSYLCNVNFIKLLTYNMMIRKKWTKYVCLVLMTWLIVGCEQKPKFIIGVSQCSEDIWREKQNAELCTAAYFHEGVELKFAAAYDSDERQVQQIDSLVNDGIDLLIVAPN